MCFQCLFRNLGLGFVKTPRPCSCSLENDMDLLQLTKTISAKKKKDNQNNFCSAMCYFRLSNRCRKSLPEKNKDEQSLKARSVDLWTSSTVCNVPAPVHERYSPKVWSACYQTSWIQVRKHADRKWCRKMYKKSSFQKYVSAFGIKSVRVHDVIPIFRQAAQAKGRRRRRRERRGEKKKRNSQQSVFFSES